MKGVRDREREGGSARGGRKDRGESIIKHIKTTFCR